MPPHGDAALGESHKQLFLGPGVWIFDPVDGALKRIPESLAFGFVTQAFQRGQSVFRFGTDFAKQKHGVEPSSSIV